MRLYLPATAADLADPDGVRAVASAVTPALRAALSEEDEEGLELSAFLTAADASVLRVARLGARPRRVVLAVEVDDVRPDEAAPEELRGLPSVLGVVAVPWSHVVAVHVDDAEAEELVAAAVGGDEEAFDALVEIDLLWFDPSELADVRAELGVG
ncbi:hypothetical protein FH969_05225 [Miniimonas arenae]|uniref:Uncharacterized protein n=1 Tax=Miniimonas arenae TaxID=676201 RepID=A0A5C5BEQ2_9MICO|nr:MULTISPECIES: hypothetical protein [Miniimonas]TNU75950.1 hypothetical protein FH969_05225 [Miniimonas arenae]